MKLHNESKGKVVFLVALLLFAQACTSAVCPPAATSNAGSRVEPTGPIRHVIVVSVDGLMPDTYLNPDAHHLEIPTLRWLVQHGASSEGVQSVFPSLTYPSHTTMVTGVNPGRHGIVSNRAFDPLDVDLESWRWYAEQIKVDPIWRLAEQRGYETAMIHWPVSVGAKVDWLLPEYWRAKNASDQVLLRALSTPGLLEGVAKEHPDFWTRYVPPTVTDDSLTDVALYVLLRAKPNLMLLHLVEVDGAQHKHGIDSPEARAAIETDDRQLARLWTAINQLGLARDTALVVLSDHGFRAASKMVRPCTLLREGGLVQLNEDGKVKSWKAMVHSNSGQAYAYLNDQDPGKLEAIVDIFAAKLKQNGSGIGRIYERDEIRALGGDPAAVLALEAADDYQFGPGCAGDYATPPAYTATHGFDPNRPEMRASLVILGPGIAHGKIQNARLIDIAPTIAEWLGLSMPNVEGTPLRVVPVK